MIRNHLRIWTIATLLSCAHIAYADIQIYSDNKNICSNITGAWMGTGSVSSPLIGLCLYQGSATISNLDMAANFNLNLKAEKVSGNLICPQSLSNQLSGTCLNGAVIINTSYGNLTGNISSNSGSASGTLIFSPGITADVSVKFNR